MTTELATQQPWYLAGWSKHISPSGMGRAAACPRSEAMPHVTNSNPFASKGTTVHRFLAKVLESGRDAALSDVENPEDVEWLSEIVIERLPAFHPDKYTAELAIAYDPQTRTARELGRNISRGEARKLAEDHEQVGVMDIGGQADNTAVVGDYKTGWGHVDPAELNWQLRSYALFLARLLQVENAHHSVIRVLDNGSIFFDSANMDALDLLSFEDDYIEALATRQRVRADTLAGRWDVLPPLHEGKHCRYCPAAAFCPAKTSAIIQLASDVTPMPTELSPPLAATAWKKVRAMQKTLERYEGILREFSRQAPIPLGDEEVLGARAKKIETIVPERAKVLLEQTFGQAGMAAASEATKTDPKMTKEGLKAALKKFVLPTRPKEEQKITWLERETLTILREGKAINTITRQEVCEHVPAKAELPAAAEEAA